MQQSILLVGVARDAILAATRRIYEFNFNSRSYAGQVTIKPALKRIGRSRTTAFIRFAVVSAARRVSFSLVRLAVHDPDAAAVGLPAGNARREMFVRVSDTFVIFLAIFVFVGVRVRIATPPEFFDKPFALFVGFQLFESFPLFVGDDVGDVFFQPVFIRFF